MVGHDSPSLYPWKRRPNFYPRWIHSTEKRDVLSATEKKYQKLWQDEKAFESSAPSCAEFPMGSVTPEELAASFPKYVNGTPHLGHAFTVSKVEFATRVARAQGKNTLYPQGFHATGMPIKACADMLVNEIALFGKNFEGYSDDQAIQTAKVAAMKKGDAKYQFQVMLSMGIPREEIHKFADANHWLYHFPQAWKDGLVQFGCAIDWRRSFITTEVNAYYDSFVRWQMRRLKDTGKIRFGKRYTVYSPKDGQPCLDHDRSSGEGVLVQEYTAVSCKVKRWCNQAQSAVSASNFPSGASIFLVAATLRPETMYGQTNLFVSTTITYGVFQVSEMVFYLVTDRAARNMAFQGIFPQWGTAPKVMEISGSDIIGTLVEAPLSFKGEVYVLPMDTIKESKGTGVVTSVPSDSPDDYTMTLELAKKAAFYGLHPGWVCSDILPIIDTPEYGDTIAPTVVQRMKINSPRDGQLAEAKEVAYKIGYFQGTMIYGDFAGKKVQEAKPLVRQQLLDSGNAFVYCEPESAVVSRSGDECVAAFLDQWYLTYGTDEEWKTQTLNHIVGADGLGFNSFTAATKNALESTLGWMNEWPLSRQYGLGTKLPWDDSQLVESLSDSTIYMAYGTIAHYLHSDIYGKEPGIGNIMAPQMTDEVWDYVFALGDAPESEISTPILEAMRREFTYWYPLDIRVSGKELINNHLVFFLYIHQAIWGEKAPQYLPKAIRLNGHVVLNGEKMSKSKGNFLALTTAIEKFGADSIRIALADGGDGVDDANFEEATANAAILKLYELRRWSEAVITHARILQAEEEYGNVREVEKPGNADSIQRSGTKVLWDELFENDLNALMDETIREYSAMNFKAALRSGFYDFMSARDSYRAATLAAGMGMHQDCVRRYVESQALMIAVIAPHWAEYIWRDVLKKPSSIQTARFSSPPTPSKVLQSISDYIKTTSARIQTTSSRLQKRKAKGKLGTFDTSAGKALHLYVASTWPAWQSRCIEVVREMLEAGALDLNETARRFDGAERKRAMPFIQELKRKLDAGEAMEDVLDRTLEFDEVEVLMMLEPVLRATVPKLQGVKVYVQGGAAQGESGGVVEYATGHVSEIPAAVKEPEPGVPSIEFVNV
ncbi:leucyl-tRNA synthetase [Thozetella sp. PMI_491]|nr:leucyl-tRNA synthetase [Thozetella sp. PMI_491]